MVFQGALLAFLSAEGTVLGAHRGYSHNAFKMTTAGQVLLIILQSISGQVGLTCENYNDRFTKESTGTFEPF